MNALAHEECEAGGHLILEAVTSWPVMADPSGLKLAEQFQQLWIRCDACGFCPVVKAESKSDALMQLARYRLFGPPVVREPKPESEDDPF